MGKSTGSGTKPGSSMGDGDRPESNQNRTKRGTGVGGKWNVKFVKGSWGILA